VGHFSRESGTGEGLRVDYCLRCGVRRGESETNEAQKEAEVSASSSQNVERFPQFFHNSNKNSRVKPKIPTHHHPYDSASQVIPPGGIIRRGHYQQGALLRTHYYTERRRRLLQRAPCHYYTECPERIIPSAKSAVSL